MPIYLFSNPADENEIVEVVMSVHDEHVYSKDGVKWDRVFTKPTASVDTKLDENNPKSFVKYTATRAGTLGELQDISAELSQKREEKNGIDPVKEQFYEKYKKTHHGTEHNDIRKKKLKEKLKSHKMFDWKDD